jgi:hypothetical protein
MMPDLMQALATERARDRERWAATHRDRHGAPSSRRSHRTTVRCGYWLISLGCRLVAPDLPRPAH